MCWVLYNKARRLLLKYMHRRKNQKSIFFLLLTFLTTWNLFSSHHYISHRTICYWAFLVNHSAENSMEDKRETLWTRHVASNTPALKHHLYYFCSASHFVLFFLHNWTLTPVAWLQQCQRAYPLLYFSKKMKGDRWHEVLATVQSVGFFCLDFFVPESPTSLQRCHTQIYTIWSYLKKKLLPQLQTMLVTATYFVKCSEIVANRGLNNSEEGLTSREHKRK